MNLAKALSLMVLLVGVGSLSACESLGPMVGIYKDRIESIIGVTVAGTYVVNVSKDGKTLVTETWTCTTDGQKLTGCHRVGVPTSTPGVAVPK